MTEQFISVEGTHHIQFPKSALFVDSAHIFGCEQQWANGPASALLAKKGICMKNWWDVDDTVCGYCGASHTGRSCSEALKEDIVLKRYPPTDLEEATRALRPDEYCASCGYQHKGWPGSCGQP